MGARGLEPVSLVEHDTQTFTGHARLSDTPKVIELVRPPENQNLIFALRRLLAEAEAGEFIGAMIVKIRDDRKFNIERIGHGSDLAMAGALAFAQHDLIMANEPK